MGLTVRNPRSSSCFATYWLCDLGQVTSPSWGSVPLSIKMKIRQPTPSYCRSNGYAGQVQAAWEGPHQALTLRQPLTPSLVWAAQQFWAAPSPSQHSLPNQIPREMRAAAGWSLEPPSPDSLAPPLPPPPREEQYPETFPFATYFMALP